MEWPGHGRFFKMKRLFLFFLCLTFSPIASAASFDCQKAATSVEKMICGDSELSGLDSAMATTYKKALASSAQKAPLIEQQRAWLKQRNLCQAADCLRDSYTKRLSELGSASSVASTSKTTGAETTAIPGISNKWVGRYYPGSEKLNSHELDDSILVKKGAGDDDMSLDEEDILLKIPSGSPQEKKIQAICGENELCEIVGKAEGKRLVSLAEVRHLSKK